MRLEEYEALQQGLVKKTVSSNDLANLTPRTLVYGYDVDRSTRHVYLDEKGLIHAVVYDHDKLLKLHAFGAVPIEVCRPSKRAYPERTDYEFAKLLATADNELCFTTFDDSVSDKNFYGLKKEELATFDFNSLSAVDFRLTVDELGLADFHWDSSSQKQSAQKYLDTRVADCLDSYIRAIHVRKEPVVKAERWLKNFYEFIGEGLLKNGHDVPITFTDEAKELCLARMKKALRDAGIPA